MALLEMGKRKGEGKGSRYTNALQLCNCCRKEQRGHMRAHTLQPRLGPLNASAAAVPQQHTCMCQHAMCLARG
jgi:hypothetical protein